MIKKYKKNNGYAILYTIVIISIIMTIAIGMSNNVNKQLILSSVARDSQTAFYQADMAVECGLYLQFGENPDGNASVLAENGTEFVCGLNSSGQSIEFLAFALDAEIPPKIVNIRPNDQMLNSNSPCFELTVDESNPAETVMSASGYNVCNPSNPKRVERSFEVRY
jgi:hypothetical protein